MFFFKGGYKLKSCAVLSMVLQPSGSHSKSVIAPFFGKSGKLLVSCSGLGFIELIEKL